MEQKVGLMSYIPAPLAAGIIKAGVQYTPPNFVLDEKNPKKEKKINSNIVLMAKK